ncbi:hypothetical protein EDD36DRAFT_493320 [Exophiala viscosa]|uniref:Uncharacterized protein n=1 Tax=Exophiala viscosa TaxID=2486360 RepID=A0AAN6IIW5_9EURO|nr:hypothetical protein EDD36DRAFT_493320 [Exophiala viscosa]
MSTLPIDGESVAPWPTGKTPPWKMEGYQRPDPAQVLNLEDTSSPADADDSDRNIDGSTYGSDEDDQHETGRVLGGEDDESDVSVYSDRGFPHKPQTGPFLVGGDVKWWLDRNFYSSFADYDKIVQMLFYWGAECHHKYAKCIKLWAPSLREMVRAIGLAWVDVRDWADAVQQDPKAKKQFSHVEPQGRKERIECVKKFNIEYQRHVVRDCLKPPAKKSGRLRKQPGPPRTRPDGEVDQDTTVSRVEQDAKQLGISLEPQLLKRMASAGPPGTKQHKRRKKNALDADVAEVKSATIVRKKNSEELAALYKSSAKKRYEEGEGVFTKDGKVRRPYIQEVVFAKDQNGDHIIPESTRAKLIDHYKDWQKQQDLGGAVYNSHGDVRQRPARPLARDENTGKFAYSEKTETSGLKFWDAISKALVHMDTGVRREPEKIVGMRVKEAHKVLASKVADIAKAEHGKELADEKRRLAELKLESAEKDKIKLAQALSKSNAETEHWKAEAAHWQSQADGLESKRERVLAEGEDAAEDGKDADEDAEEDQTNVAEDGEDTDKDADGDGADGDEAV